MKELIQALEANQKIDTIKKSTVESLSDIPEYGKLEIIIKTKKSLFGWAKNIIVNGKSSKGYTISIYTSRNPENTLLKDIYRKFKTKDWVPEKSAHETSRVYLEVDAKTLNDIVNWLHSTLN